MQWFFRPVIWLFAGSRISAHLYWIGVLALLPLILVMALILLGSEPWMSAELNQTGLTLVAICLALEAYALGGLFMRLGPDVRIVAKAIKRLGSGDLTVQLGRTETYEGDRLAVHARQATDNLVAIVSQVRASADTMVTGAREINGANQQLSQRTESQAATLEQTAAGMEELAAIAHQNADRCRHGNELATYSGKTAIASANKTKTLVSAMDALVTSSTQIGEIVGVMEGIAFQTNILALNAAVEAARAGEQGRGFAVVASEVRSLSQRSAEAAKAIRGQIEESVARVHESTQLVGTVAATINEVVASVNEVNTVLSDIADVSQQQKRSVDEINRGVMHLEQLSQENAAMVEEAHAVASQFDGEARRLSELVDRFKIDRGETREQAVKLVESAVRLLKSKGKARAFAESEVADGEYRFAEYYILVFDFNGTMLIHPTLKGQDVMGLTDDNGKLFMKAMIDAAKTQSNGWEDYRRLNPVTQKIEPKSAFYQRVDDVIIACGIYKGETGSGTITQRPLLANNHRGGRPHRRGDAVAMV